MKALLRLPEILMQHRQHHAAPVRSGRLSSAALDSVHASMEGSGALEPLTAATADGSGASAEVPALQVGDLPLLPPCALHPQTTMLDALRTFQVGC